jgi:cold shock CspA family protein
VVEALVSQLFKAEGYGFIRTPEGRELYFHRNSVLHDEFDRLQVGTGVRFEEELGEDGPQATTVQIIEHLGPRITEMEVSK